MKTKQLAYSYIYEWSSELKLAGKFRLSRSCRSAWRSVYRYCDDDTLLLDELFTPAFLSGYQTFLSSTNVDNSTIAFYMKTLRSIYNNALEEGTLTPVHGLFRNVITCSGSTNKRALPSISIARLITGDLSPYPRLMECRDYFLLSLYLQGMPFIDLIHLRRVEVHQDKIVYLRRKTGKYITVDIMPEARALFDKLASKDPNSTYFFPVITELGEAGFEQYQSVLHRINYQLKEVAQHLGIQENLSTHVARHSWATIAYHNGTHIGLVSQGMGHKSEEMTRNYLSSFSVSELGRVNRVVLRSVLLPIVNNEIEDVSPEMKMETERKLKEIAGYFSQNPNHPQQLSKSGEKEGGNW